MKHQSEGGRSGVFTLTIEDSGNGFDYPEKFVKVPSESQKKFSGRGIPLIYSLCHSLEYLGCGNKVVAEIHWPLNENK